MSKKIRAVYQLKVSLRNIAPPVWRRIQVWEDTKLPQLHRIPQLSFNWEDYHLHDLEALADPEHDEHENLLAWRGPFDPEAFSPDTINASLKRTFRRRAAASAVPKSIT